MATFLEFISLSLSAIVFISLWENVSSAHNKDSLILQIIQQTRQNSSLSVTKDDIEHENEPVFMCGNKEDDRRHKRRYKRYKLSRNKDGSINKWIVNQLTWAIAEPSRQMSIQIQKRIIRESLQVWGKVTPLTFQMVGSNSKPDITVKFARRTHGPAYDPAFDGKSTPNKPNIFGHAWGPGADRQGIAGDVHIDEDDDWSVEHKLKGVLVHELGHSMGLYHSQDPDAIMFAVYRDATELARDDIQGIQSLYGSRRGFVMPVTRRPVPLTTPRPRRPNPTRRPYPTRRPNPTRRSGIGIRPYPTNRPRVTYRPYRTPQPGVTVTAEPQIVDTFESNSPCVAKGINAVVEDPFSVVRGLYFAFTGDTVHHIMYDGTHLESAKLAETFPGAPENPEVVFTLAERETVYFIKGDKFWKYKKSGLTEESPISISHVNFPEKPLYAISLFDVEGERRLYLFGKQYWWSFYVDQPRKTPHYEIRKFSRGIPEDARFATTWSDDRLYIVSDSSYVILDTALRTMTHDKPLQGKPEWLYYLCSSNAGCSSLSYPVLLVLNLLVLIHFTTKS